MGDGPTELKQGRGCGPLYDFACHANSSSSVFAFLQGFGIKPFGEPAGALGLLLDCSEHCIVRKP
jgi:hypothetical protein